ncbi:alpha-amylase family glycosyl hydrolase [Novosphingobium sp. AAP93]|uniref:alpha-amylase family glycosyl hydrolase n=1 Tax=Novosphingobium sp. AAP93 TaxID=1523427 RepID=UPI000ABBB50E|nr:alpha-amylase family glycosyl hydrolase [Novosphingobium sp. AAP93]
MIALAALLGSVGSAQARPEMVYHIFVRSFADSNGDRQGDLDGIRQRLGYLERLGVTTVMLTPLYPSQFYHNYFADDFDGIDPEFGTMADFSVLVRDVHRRGMKIILDEEIQYVSDKHAWRMESAGHPESPHGKFLLYRDATNRAPVPTLLGTNDFSAWPGQKRQIFTVNLAEPAVKSWFARYLSRWADPDGDGDTADGVDGFRIDHMMDDLDNAGVLKSLLADFWAPVIAQLHALNPRLTVTAEQADWGDGAAFFAKGGVDRVFAFPIWSAAGKLDPAAFAGAITWSNVVVPAGRSQLVFIENHDTQRFADGAARRGEILRLGAAITMLTGWVPSIYYGQEIGMSGRQTDAYPGSADARDIPLRQAMRWVPDPLAAGNAAWYRQFRDAYNTPDSNGPGDGVSVAEQDKARSSLLNTYRSLAALRARWPALGEGTTRVVRQEGSLVLIERRTAGNEALVLFNFADLAASARLPIARDAVRQYGSARRGNSGLTTAPAFSATVWTMKP